MSPQGGVYALWRPSHHMGGAQTGRVWVESINSLKQTAIVRYDPGEGMRSRAFCAALKDIEFTDPFGKRS